VSQPLQREKGRKKERGAVPGRKEGENAVIVSESSQEVGEKKGATRNGPRLNRRGGWGKKRQTATRAMGQEKKEGPARRTLPRSLAQREGGSGVSSQTRCSGSVDEKKGKGERKKKKKGSLLARQQLQHLLMSALPPKGGKKRDKNRHAFLPTNSAHVWGGKRKRKKKRRKRARCRFSPPHLGRWSEREEKMD